MRSTLCRGAGRWHDEALHGVGVDRAARRSRGLRCARALHQTGEAAGGAQALGRRVRRPRQRERHRGVSHGHPRRDARAGRPVRAGPAARDPTQARAGVHHVHGVHGAVPQQGSHRARGIPWGRRPVPGHLLEGPWEPGPHAERVVDAADQPRHLPRLHHRREGGVGHHEAIHPRAQVDPHSVHPRPRSPHEALRRRATGQRRGDGGHPRRQRWTDVRGQGHDTARHRRVRARRVHARPRAEGGGCIPTEPVVPPVRTGL